MIGNCFHFIYDDNIIDICKVLKSVITHTKECMAMVKIGLKQNNLKDS